jgi:hypothetical protein
MVDKIKDTQKEAVISGAKIITSVQDGLNKGLDMSDLYGLCLGVSKSIAKYDNEQGSPEMLLKSPDVIFNQLNGGLSCMIVAYNSADKRWDFLHHSSIYPVFEEGEEKKLGFQIVEFGSAITHEDFRGCGLGKKGISTRLEMMRRFASNGVEVFGISTVKRIATGHAWGKFDVNPVSFWDNPYTSFLTDSCKGSSERFGYPSCSYRRSPDQSTSDVLESIFLNVNGNNYIPCTLLVTDHNLMNLFEATCRDLHASFGGIPLSRGNISLDAYKRADDFFNKLKKYAKN